jgi:hypothetical protein
MRGEHGQIREGVSTVDGGERTEAEGASPKTAPLPAPVDSSRVDLHRDVHGKVVRPDGNPIAGAELIFVTYPWRRTSTLNLRGYYEAEIGPSTLSAKDGTFCLRVRRGQLGNLRARAEGYAPAELRQIQAGEHVRVELAPGVTVLVRTVDERKQPVREVTVNLTSRPLTRGEPRWFRVTGVTNADGEALFENLPAEAKVWIESVPVKLGSPGWITYDLPEAGRDEVEVVLPEGRTITGRVVDAQTKHPIAGARVGMGWTLFRETTTDQDGRYTLFGWTAKGRYEIAVDAEGYGQVNTFVGTKESVDFELMPGGAVKGRVVDQDGEPVAGVCIGAIGSVRQGRTQVTSRRHTASSPDGTFELGGLRTDLVHALVLTAPAFGRKLVDFTPPDSEMGPLDLGDIALQPGRAIEGVLVDGSGNAIPRTEIRLVDVGLPAGQRFFFYGNQEWRSTDHLGRFRFPDQSPGRFTLNVRREGDAPVKKEVTLTATRDLLDVVVQLAAGRQFLVWVHDVDGKPVPNAVIGLRHEGGRAQSKTDEEGKATFTVQGAVQRIGSPWVIHGRSPGENPPAYVQAKPIENVPATESEARFILTVGSHASGIVLGPDGKPLASVLLEIRCEGHPNRLIRSGSDGRFTVTVPPDRTVDIVLSDVREGRGASTPDVHLCEGALRGVRGGAENLELKLSKAATDRTLTVRVEDPDGGPLEGAYVFALRARAKTDGDGRVELTNLPARAIQVQASLTGDQRGFVPPEPLDVVPDGQEVVLRFTRGVALHGIVLQPDGMPAQGCEVFVRIGAVGGRYVATVRSDTAGGFTVYIPPHPTEDIFAWAVHRQKDGTASHAPLQKVDPAGGLIELKLRKEK